MFTRLTSNDRHLKILNYSNYSQTSIFVDVIILCSYYVCMRNNRSIRAKKNRNLARFQNKKQMSIKLKQNSNIHLYSKTIY